MEKRKENDDYESLGPCNISADRFSFFLYYFFKKKLISFFWWFVEN
jgi:hypothetical protein